MNDRETELQAHNTQLVNETRMLRAQLNAAKIVLNQSLVERPITVMMAISLGIDPGPSQYENVELKKLYDRLELLEKDAWTQTGALAKQFVKAVKVWNENKSGISQKEEDWVSFVDEWADKFQALVGD